MKKTVSILLSIITLLSCFSLCAFAENVEDFEALQFPAKAISDFDESILNHASSSDTLDGNKGYDGSGTYISPYWKCMVKNFTVPVYSSLTYDSANNIGVLQSYSHIWVDLSKGSATVALSSIGIKINKASVFPSSSGIECEIDNNNIRFEINDYGIYTVLINDDLTQYGFTLFVEKYTNENEKIEHYKNEFGEENVFVFNKKYYETNKINLNDYKVIYFCRGSYFKVTHPNTTEHTNFLELSGKEDAVIDGCGTFDFNSCNHKEIDPCFINSCKNCEIVGLNFVNPDHWTFYTYACENLTIKNISSIGYRMNSDGINICNSKNITVSNSFVRTGDDSFSVKTMNDTLPCENVLFENCTAWSTKARCFGITGEVEADISNITFKNSVVIDRHAIWDNNRIGSLCIIVENGKGIIDGVTFENIEINHDSGRAINCTVYGEDVTNSKVKNILFKNITYNAEMKSQISSNIRMDFLQKADLFLLKLFKFFGIENKLTEKLNGNIGNNFVSVTFQNVKSNGKVVSKFNKNFFVKTDGNVEIIF